MTERFEPAQLAADLVQVSRHADDAAVARGGGWWPVLALALLSAVAATIALLSQQLTLSSAVSAVPNEGFHWSVSQYQIAHHRLKQELRAIAAGEPADGPDLRRRAAVLASRVSILTEPSEIKSLLDGVPGYAAATRQVAELQGRIEPILERENFSQADAARVLELLQSANDEELVSQLGNDVRMAEIRGKESLTQSLSRRLAWAWGGFALCWGTLVLWLLYAIRSRRRYRAAADARQHAVEAMEQALTAKRRFLSMVNHEVRSPLQNIVASAELLALKDNRPDSAAAIRRIRYAVTVLQGQLRDLLTIAREGSAQLPTQVETFDLGELVRDVCAGLEDGATAKGLVFEVEFPAMPVTVNADPIRIAQVLRNLVENAVRYTGTGHVRVRVEYFVAGAITAGPAAQRTDVAQANARDGSSLQGTVRFVVDDSGPGVPADVMERLSSASVPFASSSDGNGIGFFVIRDVLQQMHGRVEVQSRVATHPEGQGTTFTVSIPAERVSPIASQSEPAENDDSLSVLVVDDRSDVREALGDMARRMGHAIHAAGSAAEARPLLANLHFDVALIDLDMPETDGMALATEIRGGGGPNATALLILVSAAENQASGQVWPFDGFLQKPVESQALERLIGSRP